MPSWLSNDRHTGGCLCGAVRYTVSGATLFISQCCCRDCQKATGTGHTTILGIRRSQLAIEAGTLATYTNAGESGGTVTRHFCATCGGRIYTSGSLPGAMVMVQAGSLDNPNAITPDNVIYNKDRVAWDVFDERLPRYEALQPFDEDVLSAMRGVD
jgi:hypothetical protein